MKRVKLNHTIDTIRIGLTLLLIALAFLIPSFTSFILGKIFIGFSILLLIYRILMISNTYYDDEKVEIRSLSFKHTFYLELVEIVHLDVKDKKRSSKKWFQFLLDRAYPNAKHMTQYRFLTTHGMKMRLGIDERYFPTEDFEKIVSRVEQLNKEE